MADVELKQERILSSLLPVTHLPRAVFAAPCGYRDHQNHVVRQYLNYPKDADQIVRFLVREKTLYSFHDLRNPDGPFIRKGNCADAITSCGSAVESVLKTVCDQRVRPYDADKDTCSRLVGICRDNGLFPSFYAPIFEATGTIRNKLGDAHHERPRTVLAGSQKGRKEIPTWSLSRSLISWTCFRGI